VALAAIASANQVLVSDSTFEKNGLGALVETITFEDGFHKIITSPLQSIAFDYSQQYDLITDLTKKIQS